MLSVEPLSDDGGDEELGAVGVGTGVGHGEETGLVMAKLEVLIGKLGTVDGLATSAVVVGEVTALEHELGDDTVENAALVVQTVTLLTSAEGTEVLGGLGDNVGEQLKGNAAELGAISGDVEEDNGVGHEVG